MAAADSSSNANNENSDIETNPSPDISHNSSKALVTVPSGSPVVCLVQFASDSFAGAFMGSIFGFGMSNSLDSLILCVGCRVLLFCIFSLILV